MVCVVSVGFDNVSGSMALKLIQLTGKPASRNRKTEEGCRKSLGLIHPIHLHQAGEELGLQYQESRIESRLAPLTSHETWRKSLNPSKLQFFICKLGMLKFNSDYGKYHGDLFSSSEHVFSVYLLQLHF